MLQEVGHLMQATLLKSHDQCLNWTFLLTSQFDYNIFKLPATHNFY